MQLKFFYLLLFLLIRFTEECTECNNKTYIPPGNMKYPYGDEGQMSADVTANDTNTIVCRDREEYTPEYGRCPFPPKDPADFKLTDPYVLCPIFPNIPGKVPIPEGAVIHATNALCKKCDLQLTPDGAAVNLKCLNCHDLPDFERVADLSEKDLSYTAYYVEIANYTSVNVQGKENFNP